MSITQKKFIKAEKNQAQGLAWSFPNKQTLKPQLYPFKHPKLNANQVRIRILYFAISDMDVELLKNKEIDVFVPGHQIVGRIQAVGQNVGCRKIGQIVGAGFVKDSCKNCKSCWTGREQTCTNAQNSCTIFPDIGGFSTHVHVKSDWAFPIPNNIPLQLASPLFCAGLTAFNVVSKEFEELKRKLNRQIRICVVGMGGIGHLAVKFAKCLGYNVTVFSHTPEKQEILKSNGVVFDSFNLETEQNYKKNQNKFDVIVLAGDVPNDCVKNCVLMARRGGKICLISYFKGQISINGSQIVVSQKQITGIKSGTKQQMYKLLQFVSNNTSQNDLSLLPICQHYDFMQFERAFEVTVKNQAKFRGIVKVPEDIIQRYQKGQI